VLLGRAAELGSIEQALAAAREGHGGLLLVTGEAGIGKTRLADEASARARALGFHVAWGRTWDGPEIPPCWAWTQIVRELIDDGVPVAPGERAELAAVVPEVLETGDRPHLDFRTFDALVRLTRRAARNVPRLLVFDDLHAADAGTLQALHLLTRSLRDRQLLVIATHREAEARMRAGARELFERMAAEGTRLSLSRLGEDDVEALLRQRLGSIASGAAREIHRYTEGNPLYVHEVARVLAAKPASGGPSPERVPPEGIRGAIASHIALLSSSTRALLAAAALVGRRVTVETLAAIASIDHELAAATLSEAAEAGIVRLAPEGAELTHVLLARALVATLPPRERRRLHGVIAAHWEARSRGDARLAEIAHHLLRADGDPARAIGVARRAAAHALQHLAVDQAADLYERALARVPELPDGERVAIELIIGRGEILARTRRLDEALALCKEAARRARAIDAPDLEARAAIAAATYFNFMLVRPEIVNLLERALGAVADRHDGARARLLAMLSCALYPSPVPEQTADLAREAIALARRTGDPEVLLAVLHDAALSGWGHDMAPDARVELGREMTDLAERVDDPMRGVRARLVEIIGEIERGEVDWIEERLRAVDRAVQASTVPERGLLALVRGMHARLHGRFAESDVCIEECLEITIPEERPMHRAMHVWGQAYTRGNTDDLLAAHALGAIRMPPFGSVWVAAALGEVAAVERRLREPLPTGDFAAPTMIAALADACVLVADRDAVEGLYRLMIPAAGRFITFGPVVGAGPSDRILGGLAALRGDLGVAERHFERAIVLCERGGATPFLARTLAQYGRILSEVEPERAAPLLERAHVLARSIGMTTLASQIEQKRTNAPASPPPLRAESLELRRDGEIWTLSFGADQVQLKHSKGLSYLDELVRHPHREVHAADLVGRGVPAVEIGDAGPMLDARARQEYERRLEDLEEELHEAEAFGDQLRASRAQTEIEAIAEELSRAVGLGGRARRSGSLTERARINVQRRLKDVIVRASAGAPRLARHLEQSIKTGTFCCYRPLEHPRQRRSLPE
jgi:tetratricopeptide (TPR) repeat protein